MAQITISKSAAQKILKDIQDRGPNEQQPLLYYYRRSYSTLKDGQIVEHGDGFMLSFVAKAELTASRDIEYKSLSLEDGIDVLVGAEKSVFAEPFSINWSKHKFTFEPQGPLA